MDIPVYNSAVNNPFITNSIPATLNDLFVKLQILSMIERGKKINMGSMTFVNGNSIYGALVRAFNGEGRRGLIVHLHQIIHQAISAIAEYKNTEFCGLIINYLSESKIGINNLITTYQNDPHTIAEINVILTNIELQLDKNRGLLDGHHNTNKIHAHPPSSAITSIPKQRAFDHHGVNKDFSLDSPTTKSPSLDHQEINKDLSPSSTTKPPAHDHQGINKDISPSP